MPSPFPGMDPFLEGSEWTSFHAELAVEIARELTPHLLPRYVARAQKRFVVSTFKGGEDIAITSTYPDASLAEGDRSTPEIGGGVAMATAPLTVATVMPERIPQMSVEIRDTEQRRLVTAIEVLSPTNKQGDGYSEYVERRERILLSSAHLIEIGLLRRGQRVPMEGVLPTTPYYVFVGRAARRPLTDVWPVKLQDSLPEVPVPLLPDDRDVVLSLQRALTAVYDDFGYGASINYRKPPEIPLTPSEATWAQAQIQLHFAARH